MQTIREYTLELLRETGCDLDCYSDRNELGGYDMALDDLFTYYEHEEAPPFPIKEIAAELVKIGNEQPAPPLNSHKRYYVDFSTGSSSDGFEFDTFEAAKCYMEDTYIMWLTDEMSDWKCEENRPAPTEEQIESFDRMIDEYYCYMIEWNEEKGEWCDLESAYWLSNKELKEIGWVYWEEPECRL